MSEKSRADPILSAATCIRIIQIDTVLLVIPAKEAVKNSTVARCLATPWAFSPRTCSVGKAGAHGAMVRTLTDR